MRKINLLQKIIIGLLIIITFSGFYYPYDTQPINNYILPETHQKSISNNHKIDPFDDGPYVFIENKKLISKSIVAGKVIEKKLKKNAFKTIYKPDASVFKGIGKIAALSDIHGQYELFVELLIANKIINKEKEWVFGDGHLVITGDIFDRGPKVTEALWLVYNLEKEALNHNGKVHYLLGNHEYMVLQNDLRYINEKYQKTAELFGIEYDDLFDKNTVLGRWLRSKHTAVKINNSVFLHGGFSKEFLDLKYSFEELNNMYRETIDMERTDIKSSNKYSNLHSSISPIWYRGYFKKEFSDADISSILSTLKASRIVVGHTSQKEVKSLFDGKIYAVDSSIKRGEYGEILFIEKDKVFKRSLKGEKVNFQSTTNK